MKLFGLEIKSANAQALETKIQELTQAAAVKVPGKIAESDFPPDFFYDPNFIPANSGAGYGLYPLNYFRATAQAERLSQSNPFYHRVLEIHRDHICGQGVEFEVKTDDPELRDVITSIQEICDDFWAGDVNQLSLRFHQWIFECNMTGMLCLTAHLNPFTGFVEIGDLPSRWIVDIIPNPKNANDVVAIRTQPGDWMPERRLIGGQSVAGMKRATSGDAARYDVVRINREPYQLNEMGQTDKDANGLPIVNTDYGTLTGSVFLLRTGNLRGQKFGQGDGFHIHDLCTELEQIIYLFRRAYEIQLNVVMEMKYHNVTQEELDEKAKMVVPTAPFPMVLDENVDFQMHSPALKPADLTELVKTLGRFIAGVMGIPEFMMGDGTHTNVATAEQQTPALYQKFNLRRKQFEAFFSFMARYNLQEMNRRGQLYRSTEVNGAPVKGATVRLTPAQLKKINIHAKLLPYERNNAKDIAESLKSLTDALISMLGVKIGGKVLIDGETVQDIFFGQLAALGVTIDRAAIAAKADTIDPLSGTSPTGHAIDLQDVAAVN